MMSSVFRTIRPPGDEILVVDDTVASLQLLATILERAGYHVRLASDGELALRTVQAKPPDLVLLDIRMPRMDGYEVCRRLKADARSRLIPVIFISVADDEQDKVTGFAAGAVDYVNKPFHPEEVLARVSTHLSLRRTQMDLETRNLELEAARNGLEERVRARSAELQKVNRDLEGEVSEHRRTLIQLRESEHKYRCMVDTANEGIWMVDSAGRTVFVNGRMAEMLGTERELLAQRRMEDHLLDVELANHAERMCACRGGHATHYEQRLRRDDGGIIWVLTSSGPVFDAQGEYSGCFAMFADISELKAAEAAQRESSRRKDEFLAMLGHELRNPLASIRNVGHILKATCTNDERVRRVQPMLERQTLQLVRIVDDLLDTTRLAQGRLVLRKHLLDWAELLRASVADVRDLANQREVELVAALGDPVWVLGDAARLTQVASNLLGNALKFTGPGGQVRVGLRAERGEGVFTVTDSGAGMGPATLSRLFEPFARGAEDVDSSRGGLGLGLALAKSLVALHGGRIAGTSPGRGLGSTFTVNLPLAGPPTAIAAKEEFAQVTRAQLRVLIVEDNPDAAESLRDLLELMGHAVDLATDGASGLHQVRTMLPNVVLCDIGLPGDTNGYDVARAVRSDRRLDPVYLIAVTGYGQGEDKRRAEQAGFNLHMTKPVDPKTLERTLARIGSSAAPRVQSEVRLGG